MKIECACGELIHDVSDSQANKARLIPDQQWFSLFDLLESAICCPSDTPSGREKVFREVWTAIGNMAGLAWQCAACGRVYIDDERFQAHGFRPENPDGPRELFRRHPS